MEKRKLLATFFLGIISILGAYYSFAFAQTTEVIEDTYNSYEECIQDRGNDQFCDQFFSQSAPVDPNAVKIVEYQKCINTNPVLLDPKTSEDRKKEARNYCYNTYIGGLDAGQAPSIPSTNSNPTGAATGNNTAAQLPTNAGTRCDAGYEYKNGLCLPISNFKGGFFDVQNVGELIIKIIKVLLYIAGIVAVIMIMVGGYQYIVSAGNAEAAEKGKNTLVNAVIGLLIVMLSYTVVMLVTSFIGKGSIF